MGQGQRDIKVGDEYGYREVPRHQTPLERVRVLERVRSQWRVEWIQPNPGLRDYVKTASLVVPWVDRTKFLRDESNRARLLEACASWPGHEHPVSEAVTTVLSVTGEDIEVGNRGVVSVHGDVLHRLGARAHFDFSVSAPAYQDRSGMIQLPFDTALDFAQAFAQAEPQSVLLQVESEERQYETKAREPGNSDLIPLVHRWRAQWALCREWAGRDETLAQRDAEIERLRRILDDLRYQLIRINETELVSKLDKKLRGA
jgi:hypothetical protein